MKGATCKSGEFMTSHNGFGERRWLNGGGISSKFPILVASKATYLAGGGGENAGEGISSTDVFGFGRDGGLLFFEERGWCC